MTLTDEEENWFGSADEVAIHLASPCQETRPSHTVDSSDTGWLESEAGVVSVPRFQRASSLIGMVAGLSLMAGSWAAITFLLVQSF